MTPLERGRTLLQRAKAPRRKRWSAAGGPVYVELKRVNDADGKVAEVQLVRAGREKSDLPRWWTIGELNRAGIRVRP